MFRRDLYRIFMVLREAAIACFQPWAKVISGTES